LSDSIGARAQSCASSIYEATLTFQSERLPIQLNGFFPYLPVGPNSADTTPAIKYATESLAGKGNFIDPACGCFTNHMNIVWSGSWNFSVSDFTDQSTKTATSQVFGCVTGAGGAANVKVGMGDAGYGYYFPGPNSVVTATGRSFFSDFRVEEVTPPSCVSGSPRFYKSSLGEVLSDVVDISQAKTRAETAKTIVEGSGNRQFWNNNYPATAGEAANLIAAGQLSRTSPILCPAERISFRAQFSDLCAGRYLITYYYKKWAIGTPEPDICETPINEEVEFKDAPFLVPNTETGFRAYPFPLKQGEQCILARVTAQKMDDCKDRSAGDSNQQNNSVDMRFFLGKRSGGSSAGSLGIYAAKVVPALYTPGALTLLAAENPEVIVLKQNSVLRQIKAPECTADIVTVSPSSYEVRFYRPGQTGALDGGTGVYALSGLPYTTYLVENPDSGVSTRIRLTETTGGAQKTTVFASSGDARNGTTDMTIGNGLRTESLERVTSGSTVTETRTIKDDSARVVSLLRETKTIYPFGALVIQSTPDPSTASFSTSTTYYTDLVADGGAYGQVRQVVEPNGRWTRYTYDAQRRPLTTVTPFPGSAAIGTADNLCRVTTFSYGTIPDQDGDGVPEKLTTTVESLLGQEIGRSYKAVFSLLATAYGRPVETSWAIQSTAAGATWNASGGLVTKRRAIASGDWFGRPISELRPDGTLTTYTYVLGSTTLTTTTDTGQADPTGSTVVAGTRTVGVVSILGKPVSSTVSDIASNLLLSAEAVTQTDSSGRPTRTDFLDGTYELRSYACCGLDSFTDRQGITTT
jgi:YD repeat-containing protein